MKRFLAIIILVTVLVVGGGVFFFSRDSGSPKVSPLSGYEYFWGNGCPHCENVEKFFESWEGKNKVQIEKREVWYSPGNAKAMAARAESCNIPKSELAVPFLVTPDAKCILGDEPIIQHFKELKF